MEDEIFVIGDRVFQWKTVYIPKHIMERQMAFYSAISRGEKVAYRTTFWTRVKNWFRK